MATPLPWNDDGGRRKRGMVIAGVAGGVIVIGVIAILMHGGGKQDANAGANAAGSDGDVIANAPSVPTTVPSPTLTPAVTPIVTPIDASVAVATGSATGSATTAVIATTPPTPTTITPSHPTKPTTPVGHGPVVHPDDSLVASKPITPITPPTPPTPVVDHSSKPLPTVDASTTNVTAKDLVARYSQVGSELKALEDKHADAATDLWPRYRLIRINDALPSLDKRNETAAILAKLHHDIAARNK